MLIKIDKLTPKYDYSKDNCYLVFSHNVKSSQTVEVKAEWFDINYGEKVTWLLVRETDFEQDEKPKYRNIKLKNIDPTVKIEMIKKGGHYEK